MNRVSVRELRGEVELQYEGKSWAVPHAKIEVFTFDETPKLVIVGSADEKAHFHLPKISSGRYRLRVSSPGFLSADADVRIGGFGIFNRARQRGLLVALGLLMGPCPTVTLSDVR